MEYQRDESGNIQVIIPADGLSVIYQATNVRNGPKADTRACREQKLPCRDKVTLEPFRVCSGLANGHRALGRSQQLLLLLEFPVQLVAAAEVLFRPVHGA